MIRVVETEAQMHALGAHLAAHARPGDMLALFGDLGVGKSVLARGFIRHMMGDADLEVPSPSYALVQDYEPVAPDHPAVIHADLYRLEQPGEVVELGILDRGDETVTLIEWPERLGDWLPDHAVRLKIDIVGQQGARHVCMQGVSTHLAKAFA